MVMVVSEHIKRLNRTGHAFRLCYRKMRKLSLKSYVLNHNAPRQSKEDLAYYESKFKRLYQDIFGFRGWGLLSAFIAYGELQKMTRNNSKFYQVAGGICLKKYLRIVWCY